MYKYFNYLILVHSLNFDQLMNIWEVCKSDLLIVMIRFPDL